MRHKLHFSVLAFAALIFLSCSKKEIVTPNPMPEEYAQFLRSHEMPDFSIENGMLKFSSVEAIDTATNAIMYGESIGEDPIASKTKGGNFVSLYDLFEAAIGEFDALTSWDQVYAFKNKYKNIFLFDDNDPDNNCHYLPVNNSSIAKILNSEGNVIVGNEIINLKDLNSYEETIYYKSQHEDLTSASAVTRAPAIESGTNYLYLFDGSNNKMWAETTTVGAGIYIDLTAQRKRLFGWNHYWEDWKVYQHGSAHAGFGISNLPFGGLIELFDMEAHTMFWVGDRKSAAINTTKYYVVSQLFSIRAMEMTGFIQSYLPVEIHQLLIGL